MTFISNYLNSTIQLFYPRICPGCGEHLTPSEEFICLFCEGRLVPVHFMPGMESTFYNAMITRFPVSSATAGYFYGRGSVIQHLLHHVKYSGRQELAKFLGRKFGHIIFRETADDHIQSIVPVPLHPRKVKARGFNQSERIAEGISECTGIPVLTKAISRKDFTETQTHKSRIERWRNVSSAFIPGPAAQGLEGRSILLVDDVVTTGATLEACARALNTIPGVRIHIAALAFASEL